MTDSTKDRKARPDTSAVVDRRAAPGSPEARVRQLKGALDRPIRVGAEGGRLRVTLVDRRKAPPDDLGWLLAPLRDELRARLASIDGASQVLRHLMVVHKVLGAKGWNGLETLPSNVLAKALDQAEMLGGAAAWPLLETLAGQLRKAQAAAAKREEREGRQVPPASADVIQDLQVSEVSHEEFEAMQRSWFASLETEGAPDTAPEDTQEAR